MARQLKRDYSELLHQNQPQPATSDQQWTCPAAKFGCHNRGNRIPGRVFHRSEANCPMLHGQVIRTTNREVTGRTRCVEIDASEISEKMKDQLVKRYVIVIEHGANVEVEFEPTDVKTEPDGDEGKKQGEDEQKNQHEDERKKQLLEKKKKKLIELLKKQQMAKDKEKALEKQKMVETEKKKQMGVEDKEKTLQPIVRLRKLSEEEIKAACGRQEEVEKKQIVKKLKPVEKIEKQLMENETSERMTRLKTKMMRMQEKIKKKKTSPVKKQPLKNEEVKKQSLELKHEEMEKKAPAKKGAVEVKKKQEVKIKNKKFEKKEMIKSEKSQEKTSLVKKQSLSLKRLLTELEIKAEPESHEQSGQRRLRPRPVKGRCQ